MLFRSMCNYNLQLSYHYPSLYTIHSAFILQYFDSPAPHHDIYSIEDLRQLVYSLKEATNYEKPVIVKIAAVHNVAAIASGIARSGAYRH